MLHELKCWPIYFGLSIRGKKRFEIRKNDRNYQTGDHLLLKEYDPEQQEYTGNIIIREVTYVMDDPQFCKEGYVVMSIE